MKSQRMVSWVHCIMNPIIEVLKDEIRLLEIGNITWRFYSGKAEFIWAIEKHIEPQYIHTYHRFLKRFPQWTEEFAKHDAVLLDLENYAGRILESLDQSVDFKKLVQNKLKEYMEQEDSYPGGEELPAHYSDSDFGANYHSVFKGEYERLFPELAENLKIKKSELLQCTTQLCKKLEEEAYQICEKYDIPADPFPSLKTI